MKAFKTLSFVALLAFIFSIQSCSKKAKTVEVIRNCTGTYLEINNAEYLVVNPSSIEFIETNSKISVDYQIEAQNDPLNEGLTICAMHYSYDGYVRVLKLK